MTSQTADYVAGYAGSDPTINVVTSYYYDAEGRRIATATPTSSGSYSVTFDSYDSAGDLTSEIVNCTTSGTTPPANPATCTGGGTANGSTNIKTTYVYDTAGNRIEADAPSPANSASGTTTVKTLYVYDANNRLCRVIQNASVSSPTCGSSITSTATTNVVMAYDYDASGNLAHQYAPAPEGTTGYVYDDLGRLTSQTDADGNTTSWTYDAAGNKLSETDPDGQTVYWSYDTAGRLCRRTAFNAGSSPTWPTNRCADAKLSGNAPAVDTHYEYDNAGDLTKAKDELSGNTIAASYDGLNRPLSVSGDASGDPSTTYTYAFDNPTRTDASGTYAFTLDDYERQVGLIDPLHPNNPYAWTYAASGPVASVTDPTANVTTNTYDPLNRLTARSTTGSSGCSNCASLTYTYNDASNIVSSTSTITGSSANGTTTYTYDAIDRVTAFTPPSAIQPQTYTWNGSPDRATIKVGSGNTLTMAYGSASRLSSDSGGGNYAYDSEGRLTAMPGKTLIYDAAGRLTQVKDGSGTVLATYTYDALDRLRTITEGSATTRLRYVGLTNAVAQEIDNGSGSVLANHATDMTGTDLFDFNATGNVSGYLGRDSHADVVWTASTTGAVAATLTYDPFGNLVSSTGSTLPNTRWQSSYRDSATGLYYVIARWYAPSLGTFLSTDPVSGTTVNPQSRDLYAYGAGDAVDRVDPNGRCSYDDYFSGCNYATGAAAYRSYQAGIVQRVNARVEADAAAAARRRAQRALALAHQYKQQQSVDKYNKLLSFLVTEMKRHARGEGYDGSGVGPFDYCQFCNNPGVVDALLVANPVIDLLNPLFAWNVATLANFGNLFRTNDPWDDKRVLTSSPTKFFKTPNSEVDYTFVPHEGDYVLSFTVWGNIDFAFTGRAWGMSRDLIEGGLSIGGRFGIAGHPNVPSNQVARSTGYELWDMVNGNANALTTDKLNEAIVRDYANYKRRGAAVLFGEKDWGWDIAW